MTSGSRASAIAVPTEHGVTAQLHGEGCVGGRADPGGDDDRHRRGVQHQADGVRISNAEARPHRRRLEHDAGRAGLLEPPDGDGIVTGDRQRTNPSRDKVRVASSTAGRSGISVRASPMTSTFTKSPSPDSRAR